MLPIQLWQSIRKSRSPARPDCFPNRLPQRHLNPWQPFSRRFSGDVTLNRGSGIWARDWPDFRYDASALEPFEQKFLLSSGEILGAVHHVSQPEREQLRIELLSEEEMQTSAIERELLDDAGPGVA